MKSIQVHPMDEDGTQWIDMEAFGCHWISLESDGLKLTSMAHHGNLQLENDFTGWPLTLWASIFSHSLPWVTLSSVTVQGCPCSIKLLPWHSRCTTLYQWEITSGHKRKTVPRYRRLTGAAAKRYRAQFQHATLLLFCASTEMEQHGLMEGA